MTKPKKKPVPDQPGRVAEAFAYYYSLATERTLKKVAAWSSLKLGTVKDWSSKYKWQAQVLKLDLDVAARVRDKLASQAANRTLENLKIIDRLRVRFTGMLDRALTIEDKKGNTVKVDEGEARSLIDSMDDFSKLVKLELLLMEKPTEITEEHGKYIVISAVPSSKPEAED